MATLPITIPSDLTPNETIAWTGAQVKAPDRSISGGDVAGPPGPPGPPGPTAVSTDAGNKAVLGTDGLLYVTKLGVTDGSDAGAGEVGEYVVQENTDGVIILSDTPSSICTLDLTSGVWEIWGVADFNPTGNGGPTMITASISVTDNALPSDTDMYSGVGVMTMLYSTSLASKARQVLLTGQCRSNSAAPLTVYLVAQSIFPGGVTMSAKGYICARRVR